MAEASGGKPDLPPSKEGDAGGDSDHPDDSSSEFLEPGEVADSSASDGESSADELDSTAGDLQSSVICRKKTRKLNIIMSRSMVLLANLVRNTRQLPRIWVSRSRSGLSIFTRR